MLPAADPKARTRARSPARVTAPCVVAAVGLLAACGSPESPPRPGPEPTASGATGLLSGRAAYDAHCAACHDEGSGGAPAISDATAWAGRSPLWMAVLAEHAKNGYLDMPAAGGAAGTANAEIEAATEYMMSVVYPGRPASL